MCVSYIIDQWIYVFVFSMANNHYSRKLSTGQTQECNIPKDLRPALTLPRLHTSRPNQLPMAVPQVNHLSMTAFGSNILGTATSRPSHLPRINLPYSRYPNTSLSASIKSHNIRVNNESSIGAPRNRSKLSMNSGYVPLSDSFNKSSYKPRSVSPWDTLGKRNVENGAQSFSAREFLEACSPCAEEDTSENSSHWDSSLNGSLQSNSYRGSWCFFPKLRFV